MSQRILLLHGSEFYNLFSSWLHTRLQDKVLYNELEMVAVGHGEGSQCVEYREPVNLETNSADQADPGDTTSDSDSDSVECVQDEDTSPLLQSQTTH